MSRQGMLGYFITDNRRNGKNYSKSEQYFLGLFE